MGIKTAIPQAHCNIKYICQMFLYDKTIFAYNRLLFAIVLFDFKWLWLTEWTVIAYLNLSNNPKP